MEGHRHFLAVDYSIEGGTLEARALILYAIIMIFVYAIGQFWAKVMPSRRYSPPSY